MRFWAGLIVAIFFIWLFAEDEKRVSPAKIPEDRITVIRKALSNHPKKYSPPRTTIDSRAIAIDGFFLSNSAPLTGYGQIFVDAANCGIDWRLLPAIAWKESHGGKSRVAKIYKNPFGLGDPNFFRFSSFKEAIYFTARMLCGNSRYYDSGMHPRQILRIYNPAERRYPHRVMAIMQTME